MKNLFTKKEQPTTITLRPKVHLDNNIKDELCQIYSYLLVNCYGYEKRQKAHQIMNKFGIKDHKCFRDKIQSIRRSRAFGFVSSEAGHSGGYWIPASIEEAEKTIIDLSARSLKVDSTCSLLEKKMKYMKRRR